MRYFNNSPIYIVLALAIWLITYLLDSNEIYLFLQKNIISLLVTLLAINTATLGLLASKLHEVSVKKEGINFKEVTKEMSISLTEQIALIAIAFATLIFIGSEIICWEYKSITGNIILLILFIADIDILRDTGKSVFVLLDLMSNSTNNKTDH